LLALAVLSAVALFFLVVVLEPGVVAVVYDPFTGSISGPNVNVNPLPVHPGGSATILLSVSNSGKCSATVFIPGQSIEVRLRTASGTEYAKLVVLP